MRLILLSFSLLLLTCAYGQHKATLIAGTENDSVVIYSNIKNPTSRFIIDSIVLEGNKVTKKQIIFRELTFKKSDTISAYQLGKKLSRSRENLLNTSLFNFVTVHDSIISPGNLSHVHIHIHFIERWYLWPVPIIELSDRNFNTWLETKDYKRISYGLSLVKENMRGRMEKLSLLLRFGFDETYQLSYDIPYINKKQTFGAGIGIGLIQNHQVAYKSVDNQLVSIRDNDKYLTKKFYSYLSISHRPSFYQHHTIQLNYNYYSFDDTLLSLNPDYSFNHETTNEYLSLLYRYTHDERDSKNYPLSGKFLQGTLSKSGFGIFQNGDISMMEVAGSYRQYWQLPKKFYFSTDWTGKISTSRNQPYYYQRGLGFGRSFVRGYELYVIDGQSFALSKNTIKFNLIPTSVKNFKFLHSEKFGKIHYAFYVNWFLDLGYVDDFKNTEGNVLANQIIAGTGIGLDLVTYYDMVFRVEFTINKEGEFGVFFHLSNTL